MEKNEKLTGRKMEVISIEEYLIKRKKQKCEEIDSFGKTKNRHMPWPVCFFLL